MKKITTLNFFTLLALELLLLLANIALKFGMLIMDVKILGLACRTGCLF